MNGMQQKPTKKDWKEIVEDLKTSIHNGEQRLELLKAQLQKAIEKSR